RANPFMRNLFRIFVVFVGFSLLRGNYQYVGWSIMLLLIWRMRPEHPRTANDDMPLGRVRTVLGWVTLTFVLVGFVPSPMYISALPAKPPQPPQQQQQQPIERDPERELEV